MPTLVRVSGYGPDGIGDPVERFWLDGEPIELIRDLDIDPDLLHRNPQHYREWYEQRLDGLPAEAQATAREFIDRSLTEGGVRR